MVRITVLGGCGAVGRHAVKALAGLPDFDEVVIADLDLNKAKALAAKLKKKKVSAKKVDALDRAGLKRAVQGSDVVLNFIGPFYKFALPVLKAVIAARIAYVDICDDVDVTLEILKLDGAAKKAGIAALIGMGSSPGATNLLAKFAADHLLDEVDSIDIFHAHGGEPVEGPGVIEHRLHCITMDIPMFLDGRLQWVKFFEPEGVALRQEFEFPVLGKVKVFPYPHPEQVTLPQSIRCRQVTNKGVVLPDEYAEMIRELCRLGLADQKPLPVKGREIAPHDFLVAYIVRERERILKETKFGAQRGCASVVVKGRKAGAVSEFRFHMASASQAMGEGTAIPAVIGALCMLRGKIKGKGVMPPEACIAPLDFIGLVPQVMALDAKKEGGAKFGGVIVEQVDAAGKVTKLDI